MLIPILALAMIFGGIIATAALIAGWSFFAALAAYSGAGLLGVMMIVVYIAAVSTWRQRKAIRYQTDTIVDN